ncbi:MAG: AAA family ATPase [Candidatus Levybacteria bacterium]|nr:AAA family ATPase [Candidatus Levybacteria bacterium]
MDVSLPLETQIEKLVEKAKEAQLPQDLLEKIEEEINLLKASLKGGSSSSGSFMEFESIVNYINWVTSVPFNKETKDILDLELAKKVLDKNHHGLSNVKNVILEYLSSIILNVRSGGNNARAPILCLVGLVGTGKTTLGYSIAESMGRNFERIPFGGMGDASDLRGKSRAVSDATPGILIKSIIHAQSKNCVILLDELDRVTEEGKKDIMGVLVELLDPEQNKSYVDHYIDYPFDLSKILFVATANNTTGIATAVLDRLQLIQMPSYTDEEKIVIARNYLLTKIRSEAGLSESQLSINEDVWPGIIRPLGYDSGIRSLQRTIEGICRKVARMIVEGKIQSVNVTTQNVKEFLPTE